jgi:hypothetical protein
MRRFMPRRRPDMTSTRFDMPNDMAHFLACAFRNRTIDAVAKWQAANKG